MLFMKSILIPVLIVFLSAVSFKTFSQAGTPDKSFGVNGGTYVTGDSLTYFGAVSRATAVQQDGKIIIAGVKTSHFTGEFVVSRSTPNGKNDSSFGLYGVEREFDTFISPKVEAVVIQSDGKIIIGGSVLNDGDRDFYLARYKSNGERDASFGTDGKVITDIGSVDDELWNLAIQNDGKILAAGSANGVGGYARYNADGTLDATFGENGILYSANEMAIFSVKPLSDGKFITSSSAPQPGDNSGNNYTDFRVARHLNNGALDASFGDNGQVLIDFFQKWDDPRSLALLQNNDIIVAGTTNNQSGLKVVSLAKIKSTGGIDSTFGINGRVNTNFIQHLYLGNSVLIESDQKIIVTWLTENDGIFRTERFLTNGKIDSTYGTPLPDSTIVNLYPEDYYANFNFSTLQNDDKLVIVGGPGFGAARLNGDPRVSIQKNISKLEGNTGTTTSASFKIILDIASTKKITVKYTTVDSTAKAGQDYIANSGTLTFQPGQTSKHVTVSIIGDDVIEKNEKFSLRLSNPINAILGTLSTAIGTIKNDDVSGGSATNAIATTSNIKLYPNPVSNTLRIEGMTNNTNTMISVVDMQGRLISKSNTPNTTYSLDIKQLSAGTYFVKIETGKNITTLKFVKE
jgi:uncharacterized delta-60 repeat protein